MPGAFRCSLGAALALCLSAPPAFAGTVEFRCRDMPSAVMSDLVSSIVATMNASGTRWSVLRIECDGSGVWLVWFDGSRALVGQPAGLVPGTRALGESRLAFDRGSAAHPGAGTPAIPDAPSRPDLEVPPGDDVVPDATRIQRNSGT